MAATAGSGGALCARGLVLGLIAAGVVAGGSARGEEAPLSTAGNATTTPNEATRTTIDGEDAIIVTARHYVPEGALTATKTGIPLVETPQSVSVITRDQIDLLNFIDLQQAVRYTAGVFGENYGPDPRYDFVTVRGFTPKQFIDGLAVPATTTIASTGVDLYAFESVDILKGPSSILYGSAPPGGIVNETSRRPSSEFGGEFEGKYGNNDFAEAAMTVTGPATGWLDARFTGLYRDADSIIRKTNTRRVLAAPSATVKLGSSTRLTGLLYYQYDRGRGGQGGFLPAAGTLLPNPNGRISRGTNLDDPADEFDRRQFGAGFNLEHRFGEGLGFTSNTKWSHYKEETPVGLYSGGGFVTVDAANPADPANFRTLQQYNFSYAERVASFTTDNRLDARFDTGALRHTILLGLDYRNVRNLAAYNFVFAGLLDAFNPVYDPAFEQDIGFPTRYNQQRLKQTGVYGQDQMALGGLRLLLSARYDWVRTQSAAAFNAVTTPPAYTPQKQHKFTYRAGLTYVTDAGIAPYVSYATSFEPVLGTDIVTAQPFRPTASKQYEGGVKFDARGMGDAVKLFATLAAFDIKERNFVTAQVGQPQAFGTQGGLVEVYGGEFELVGRIHDQLSLNASYSYNHSRVKSDPNTPANVGFPLPTTPKHKASGFADYTFQKGALGGFGFGAGVRYNSKSAGALGSSAIVTGQATLFDAILHYDLPGFRFALNASNILDKNYVARCSGPFGCVYGQSRQIIGTITKKF